MILVHMEAILLIILTMASIACVYLNLVLHQKKYAHHVVFAQPTKAQKRLLEHPYMYFICALLLIIFYTWFLVNYMRGGIQQFCFGVMISLFSMIVGQSIGGIAIFLYSIRNPEKILGQAVFKDTMFRVLHLQNALMPCLVLVISLALIHRTPFILGSLVAAMAMMVALTVSTYTYRGSAPE